MLLQPYLPDTHIYTLRMQTQHQWGTQIELNVVRNLEDHRTFLGPDNIHFTLFFQKNFKDRKTMKDNEDGTIDLIFYCIGCNIVDILGMVGEFLFYACG